MTEPRDRPRGRDVLSVTSALLGVTSALVIVVAVLAVFPAARVWPPTASAPVTTSGAVVTGEASGRVKRAEAATRTIELSVGSLGFGVMTMKVDPDTAIFVGDREGGFGDIREGLRVRVAYELPRGTQVARTRAIFVDSGAATGPPAPPGETPSAAARSPATSVAETEIRATSSNDALLRSDPGPRLTETPHSPPSSKAVARRPVRQGVDRKAAAARVEASRRRVPQAEVTAIAPPASPASAPPEVARHDGGSGDGTAAIDWLLKEYPQKFR